MELSDYGKTQKDKKLEHYADRNPKSFIQIDCFNWDCDVIGGDMFRPDKDGYTVCFGTSIELMHGAPVRVLISPSVDPQKATAMLKKIADSISETTELFTSAKREEARLNYSCAVTLVKTILERLKDQEHPPLDDIVTQVCAELKLTVDLEPGKITTEQLPF